MKTIHDHTGRQVRFTEERLRHILQHPEMIGMEAAMEQTLQSPQLVIESLSDPDASLFYRFYTQTKVGDKWLCVVVKYRMDDAFIVTAYLTDRPKQGSIQWPKK